MAPNKGHESLGMLVKGEHDLDWLDPAAVSSTTAVIPAEAASRA
jgi:hypothetical protein